MTIFCGLFGTWTRPIKQAARRTLWPPRYWYL